MGAIRAQFGQPDHPGAIAEARDESDVWEYGHKEALAGTDKSRTAVRSAVCADASRRRGHRRPLRFAARGRVREFKRASPAEKLDVDDGTKCASKRKQLNNRRPFIDETILDLCKFEPPLN